METNAMPLHVGIIMDGNGRWATQRNLPRTAGHREGLTAAKRIVAAAAAIGIRYLTFYTFSTENWKRTQEEVSFLMLLIATHLRREYDFYRENGVRVLHSGDIAGLPREVRAEIDSVMRDTASFDRMTVVLAINYGGRDEIVRGVNRWLAAGGVPRSRNRISGKTSISPMSRPGSHHQDRGGDAALQFPDLARGVRRILFIPQTVA
jgi:undecaprenyl diphosphate synthase